MNTYYITKSGMAQVWDQTGKRYVTTIASYQPLTVTQVKTLATDGYTAIQVGYGRLSDKHLTRPLKGHLKSTAASGAYPRHLHEIRVTADSAYTSNQVIQLTDIFAPGDRVHVTGISKGRGFSGAVKRWGFKGGPKTHGQSDRLRAPGSIGQGTSPGRIHKGKRMPGRYGNQQFTIKNLTILHIDPVQHRILLSGPVPGPANCLLTLIKVGSGKAPELSLSSVPEEPAATPAAAAASPIPEKPPVSDTNIPTAKE